MATWIDDDGRQRECHDDKYQLILLPSTDGEVWYEMDSWDVELACRLIVLGYDLDVARTVDYGFKECPPGSTGNDKASAICTVMDRALTLAKSAVAIGKVRNPDTPANWLAWAQGKGYSVSHLLPDATSGTTECAAPVATHAAPNKTRTNSLDAPIKKAIEVAGSPDTAAVWVHLKELALSEMRPFTGATEDGCLCYTDDDDQPALLTKAQLGKRLKKHVCAPKRT